MAPKNKDFTTKKTPSPTTRTKSICVKFMALALRKAERKAWYLVPRWPQKKDEHCTPLWRNQYIPGICLSSILGLEPSKRRPLLFNTRVMWVPGIHIHILGCSTTLDARNHQDEMEHFLSRHPGREKSLKFYGGLSKYTSLKDNMSPENRPFVPKRKRSASNFQPSRLSGAKMLFYGRSTNPP